MLLAPQDYTIIASLFPRLLGVIYFFAIGAFFFQIKGLIGKNGILPLQRYLNLLRSSYPKKCYYYIPTLFWLNAGDRALMFSIIFGTLLSICLICGFFPSLSLILLYILYLSIVSVGQDFLSFGWEGFLLEITFQTFLMNLTAVPNLMVWLSLNFLLFRFHFQAGAVKLQSRDKSWRELTAIAYHYQTQPLPNTIAWYAYKFPLWFHKLSTALMFAIELIIPFGIFGTSEMRLIVFIAFLGLQWMIWLTGNFSYLNHLTAIFSTILLSNTVLAPFIALPAPAPTPSLELNLFLSILGSILLILQGICLWNQFCPNKHFKQILYWISPFHLINRYGIFAIMTTKRYEIIIEGSADRQEWKEYTFFYKPSELTRRPRRISPYQPRIDWQAWFLPFSTFESESWFQHFLIHLLKGTPEVLQLMRGNPFPNQPPRYIRALIYEYEFSSYQEKKEKGWWWKRTLIGSYSPVMKLSH